MRFSARTQYFLSLLMLLTRYTETVKQNLGRDLRRSFCGARVTTISDAYLFERAEFQLLADNDALLLWRRKQSTE